MVGSGDGFVATEGEKRMKTRFFSVALAFTLSACGGIQADYPREDAGPTADKDDEDDAGAADKDDTSKPKPDASKPLACDSVTEDCDEDGRVGSADCMPYDGSVFSGATEQCNGKDDNCDGVVDEGCVTTSAPTDNQSVDNDGDGYFTLTTQPDCNDNNANIHPLANEVCGNGKDDNCNGTVDEGCATTPPPAGSQCVDADKDGYCTLTGQPDCNDQDANVKPGATEQCNGIDDDCDGLVDEACSTRFPIAGSTATFTVAYPDNSPRTLNVQVYDHKSDLGGWWDKSASDTDKDVTLSLNVLAGICGFRLNVSEGNPASSWLCAGNGSTASLDPDASVYVAYNGVTYTKTSMKTWSAPGGTNAGCSGLLVINAATECQP